MPNDYEIPQADKASLRKRQILTGFVLMTFDGNKFKMVDAEKCVETVDKVTPKTCTSLMQTNDIKSEIVDVCVNVGPVLRRIDETFHIDNSSVKNFIKCIAPQYCHPQLSPIANYTQFFDHIDDSDNVKKEILNKISIACGLSYKSWEDPQIYELALTKYHEAYNEFSEILEANRLKISNENWPYAAAQLLCLCARLVPNSTTKNLVGSLINSFKILQIRFGFSDDHKNDNDDDTFTNQLQQELNLEITNTLISIENNDSISNFNFGFNKLFLESFIYNYTTTILISNDAVNFLPSPFELFRKLKYLLKKPVFSCEVAWMNNPVFGAALDSFEILSKACYLFRKISNNNELLFDLYYSNKIKKLRDLAKFFPSPIIPNTLRHHQDDPKKYEVLKDSVLISEIVLKSSRILLKKIYLSNLNKYDSEVLKESSEILTLIKKLSKLSSTKAILILPSFICGLVVNSDSDRVSIIDILKEIGEVVHTAHVYGVIDWLKKYCWEKDLGLDVLFNEDYISKLVL